MCVFVAIVFFFMLLCVRLACVQTVSGKEYSLRAAEQWYRDLPINARRGVIYDKNGSVIAGNRTVYTVYVRPGSVENAQQVAEALSVTLDVDYQKLLDKINAHSVSEITVKRAVDADICKPLIERELPGVYFSVAYSRSYPYPEYLAQVVGFTNIDGDGQNGLEGYYDRYLKGTDGAYLVQSDNRGGEVSGGERYYLPSIDGADITTTIDVNLQAFCEEAVASATIEWQAKGATMLIMEADTGAIAAMAQSPSYLLDDLPRDDVEILNAYSKNKMIVDVYEPGSTFKIFTTAIAIEEGIADYESRFYCPGYRMVDGQRIRCWRTKGHGSQSLIEGVQNSCNCVFMDLALRLGCDELYDGLEKFGFGSKTGVDFFGESSGILMKRSTVKSVDLARIGFGQAIAVTPVQLAAGVAAAVNGGIRVQPHFVESVTAANGTEIYRCSAAGQRVIRRIFDRRKNRHRAEIRKRRYRARKVCFVFCGIRSRRKSRIRHSDDGRRTFRGGVLRQHSRRSLCGKGVFKAVLLRTDRSYRAGFGAGVYRYAHAGRNDRGKCAENGGSIGLLLRNCRRRRYGGFDIADSG